MSVTDSGSHVRNGARAHPVDNAGHSEPNAARKLFSLIALVIATTWLLILSGFLFSFKAWTGSDSSTNYMQHPKESRGWQYFASRPVGLNPKNDGVAFFVQVSQNNSKMLGEWMRRAYHPHNTYLIHIESGVAAENYSEAKKATKELEDNGNVMYLEPREAINEDGVSQLLNLLNGLSTLLLRKESYWTHVVFSQPDVFPLLSPQDLRTLLTEMPEVSFLSFGSFASIQQDEKNNSISWRMNKIRIDPPVYDRKGGILELGELPFDAFPKSDLVIGSSWQVLSRQDGAYAIVSPRAKWMLGRVATVFRPDEWFFGNLFLERESLQNGLDKKLLLRNDRLHEFMWHHPTNGQARGKRPWPVGSNEDFFRKVSSSGALFTGVFDQSQASRNFANRIDSTILKNKTYVQLARTRMTESCLATEKICRDETKDSWFY